MNINIQKLSPWNWFKHENENASRVPVYRGDSDGGLPALFGSDTLWNMHREVDRLFNSIFERGGGLPRLFERASGFGLLKPSVNIKETKKEYQISVEIPGVEEGDIALELSGNSLVIKGEKKQEKTQDDENYHWVERSYGSFSRTLALPADADLEAIEAKFKSGVLNVNVPRRQVAKQKENVKVIDIKRAA